MACELAEQPPLLAKQPAEPDVAKCSHLPSPASSSQLPKTFHLGTRSSGTGDIRSPRALSATLSDPHFQRRLVFFVRHGESEWNRGKDTWALDAVFRMATRRDHALSEAGVNQARRLEGDILRAMALRRDDGQESRAFLEACFVHARTALCSPLTRAVQTAAVGLRPLLVVVGHPVRPPLQLRLMKEIRERRNRGGRDTIGTRRGSAVKVKVKTWLAKKMGDNFACEYDGILDSIDYSDVQGQWWDVREETGRAVSQRMGLFVEELCSVPQGLTPIIAVGHSHFFREMFRRYAGHGEGAKEFKHKVISNCGVVAVTFEFPPGGMPRITSQRLIFTSSLVEPGGFAECASGPRAAVVAILVFVLTGLVQVSGWAESGRAGQAVSIGLLLAQALQRFMSPSSLWVVVPLWVVCAISLWYLDLHCGRLDDADCHCHNDDEHVTS